MAVLSSADRAGIWAVLMQQLSDARASCSITKVQFRAAIDAADDWADSNATSYNNALPAAARNALTAKQKAMLLAYVILRRFEVS